MTPSNLFRISMLALATTVGLAGCHRGSSGDMTRNQQNYDVVQEGGATGVTSTISAPGDTQPPVAAMTGTNVDTTTAMSITSTLAPTTASHATLTPPPPYPVSTYKPTPAPETATMARPTRPAKTETVAPAPEPRTEPEPTPEPETTATEKPPAEEPPPATETTSTNPPWD